MNPYEAPALSAVHDETPGHPRSTVVALWCAGYVVLYYALMTAAVVSHNNQSPPVKLAFTIGLPVMIVLGLLGFVLGLVELGRNRNGRRLPLVALFANGAGLLLPAILIVKDIVS